MNDRYVYVLLDRDDIFYVGKGTRAVAYSNPYRRPSEHIREAAKHRSEQSNHLKCDIINMIIRRGDEVGIRIIQDNLTESQAIQVETALIK